MRGKTEAEEIFLQVSFPCLCLCVLCDLSGASSENFRKPLKLSLASPLPATAGSGAAMEHDH